MEHQDHSGRRDLEVGLIALERMRAAATGLHEVGDAASQLKALADSKDREIERLRAALVQAVCPECHKRESSTVLVWYQDGRGSKLVRPTCDHEFHRLAKEAEL